MFQRNILSESKSIKLVCSVIPEDSTFHKSLIFVEGHISCESFLKSVFFSTSINVLSLEKIKG
jgi:hypothetical protein